MKSKYLTRKTIIQCDLCDKIITDHITNKQYKYAVIVENGIDVTMCDVCLARYIKRANRR